jgi:protein-L-isoaspartate(D-aspartate) O-methyltransferase
MADFAVARRNMVESQIRTNRVTDPALIDALAGLPRELFVPAERRGAAYLDDDVRIAESRFLMEPLVLARLLQVAEVGKTDVALDVGCGTGYATAVLAKLAATAVGLETDPNLARLAGKTLAALAIDNVIIVEGDLAAGYPKHGPYDVILINGAVADLPRAILDQLAEGGRLVTVRRRGRGMGEGVLAMKTRGAVSSRAVFDAATPYLAGFEPRRQFTF